MAWKTAGDNNLHVGDLVVIVGYFSFVLFVGLWSSRKNRGTAGGYFLAGRNMNWIPVGASLFASNIGSLHFVGLAGSGAAGGVAIGLYELNAMIVVLTLGYIFLPVYISSGVFTMPEYLKRRFGGKRIQMYLAVLALLVYIFTKISADLYAGALFIEQSIGWDIYPAILLLLAIAAIFTITGGLTAVLWTDLIQTVIMLIGAVALMIISFEKVGGLQGLIAKYPLAIANRTAHNIYSDPDTNNTSDGQNAMSPDDSLTPFPNNGSLVYVNDTRDRTSTCGLPREDYMHMFRDPSTGDLPWPGLTGIFINSVWYWCADQVIVQRSLAGKTYDHSKMGCILCGFLKILPFFLLVLPGMIARVLFTETVGCSNPEVCTEVCGSRTGCSNIAYPMMVLRLMPPGARGMMLAVMMSALMSSLTSIFNSSATIFAMDIWTHIRRRASELEVMVVGRIFVVILVVISIIWVPVVKASQGSQLFVYIQEVSSFLQPPICAVFLMAIFWPRFNEKAAFFSLLIGMTAGMIRFGVQYSYTVPECGSGLPDPTPSFVKDVHYLYVSPILFVLTLIVAAVITLFTRPVDERCIQRLTWWSRHSKKPCWDINEWSRDPDRYSAKMAAIQTEITYGRAGRDENARFDDVEFLSKVKETGEQKVLTNTENEECVALSANTIPAHQNTESDLTQQIDFEIKEGRGKGKFRATSFLRRALAWACGVDDGGSGGGSAATRVVQQQDMVSIQENPRWKRVTSVLSILVLITSIAMMIIFA